MSNYTSALALGDADKRWEEALQILHQMRSGIHTVAADAVNESASGSSSFCDAGDEVAASNALDASPPQTVSPYASLPQRVSAPRSVRSHTRRGVNSLLRASTSSSRADWGAPSSKSDDAPRVPRATSLAAHSVGDRGIFVASENIETGITLGQYNAMILACDRPSHWAKALALYEELKAAGLVPNLMTYNAVMDMLEEGHQWEHALQLFSELKERGLTPNSQTYNVVANVCMQGEQWETALALMEEINAADDLESYEFTLSAIIGSCIGAGAWDRVWTLVRDQSDRQTQQRAPLPSPADREYSCVDHQEN